MHPYLVDIITGSAAAGAIMGFVIGSSRAIANVRNCEPQSINKSLNIVTHVMTEGIKESIKGAIMGGVAIFTVPSVIIVGALHYTYESLL